MTSHLRLQSNFAPFSAHSTQASFPHATSPRPAQKKQKMTITQTYRLAHSARGKLSSEASRGDHDLRLLVGHANLLDSLMLELQDAENEQEAWFNETMRSSSPKSPEEPKHIQWIDQVASLQESEEADDESDADSEDDYDEDALIMTSPLNRIRSPPPTRQSAIYDEEDDDDDDDDMDSDDESDNLDLALVRTRSRQQECPDLVHDSDESDDDSQQPPSPPQQPLSLADIQAQQGIKSQDFAKPAQALLEGGYFLRPREPQAPLIAAY